MVLSIRDPPVSLGRQEMKTGNSKPMEIQRVIETLSFVIGSPSAQRCLLNLSELNMKTSGGQLGELGNTV